MCYTSRKTMMRLYQMVLAFFIASALILWQSKYFSRTKTPHRETLTNSQLNLEDSKPWEQLLRYIQNERGSNRILGEYPIRKDKYYKILYWTPYYKFEDYGFGLGRKVFEDLCGKDYYCEATNDKKELDSSDVILIHNWHVMTMGLPPRRTLNQIYVFNTMEPPLSDHGFVPSKFHDVFNLTITYRTDSDLPTPYFNKKKISSEDFKEEDLNKILKRKIKAVSWFVSDCHTPSKREDYVRELKKYIKVDIFGKCGIKDVCKKQVKGCMGQIISQYYFYLSFEKILCQDYITEKVMHPYKYKTIPIVRGLGQYDVLMPNHSYIHVNDFSSPKDLAMYLHELMNDTQKYLEYFEWRNQYYFAQRPRKLCLLCRFLMDNPGFKSIYHNFTEYWWPTNQCEMNQFETL